MSARLRCAIYTRKSSEEGLEQGFNSLHAQREACEAYVKSQAGEGWGALPTQYDDGGFSGGSMDRPGLKALLSDVAHKRIDVVVVYKVDRLTRSLADFAKIVDIFDANGVSFVSVTQAFNTTTSMGRLTLNLLLSFAQFEREVTGERIRDKIAASKAKGMWMGGLLPLGYDAPTDPLTRTLVVNENEAEVVRLIFRRYLAMRSVHALQRWLEEEGIRSKRWTTRNGQVRGARVINRGALFHLLKNRTYIGEIPHRDLSYPAAHPPIVDLQLFSEVQGLLQSQARGRRERVTQVSTMMLKGVLFDAEGEAMSPTFTHRGGGRVYRYYVSTPLQQGARRNPEDQVIRRVSAEAIEAEVKDVIAALSRGYPPAQGSLLVRVEVRPTTVQVLLRRSAFFRQPGDPDVELQTLRLRLGADQMIAHDQTGDGLVRVTLPCQVRRQGGGVTFVGGDPPPRRPPRPDRGLVRSLQSGHRIAAQMGEGELGRPESLRPDQAPLSAYDRKTACLAFLAPDIQAQILEGQQPPGLTLQRVLEVGVPPSWVEQRRLFGIPC